MSPAHRLPLAARLALVCTTTCKSTTFRTRWRCLSSRESRQHAKDQDSAFAELVPFCLTSAFQVSRRCTPLLLALSIAHSYFRENPKPFYMLAKELFPGQYKVRGCIERVSSPYFGFLVSIPHVLHHCLLHSLESIRSFCVVVVRFFITQPTKSHFFIKLMDQKGLLLRNYTQNIDNLERLAGESACNAVDGCSRDATVLCCYFLISTALSTFLALTPSPSRSLPSPPLSTMQACTPRR